MNELHVGKINSFIGRILRAFGVKKASIEEECTQYENTSLGTPSDSVPCKTHSQRVARGTVSQLELRKSQVLLDGQRRPFTG